MATVTGRRRALFIGINYYGQKGELKGCINDVHNIKNFLTKNFKIDEVLVLTDDQSDSSRPQLEKTYCLQQMLSNSQVAETRKLALTQP